MLFCLPCNKSGNALSFLIFKSVKIQFFMNKKKHHNFLNLPAATSQLTKRHVNFIFAYDVTSYGIDTAAVTLILFNFVYISSNK